MSVLCTQLPIAKEPEEACGWSPLRWFRERMPALAPARRPVLCVQRCTVWRRRVCSRANLHDCIDIRISISEGSLTTIVSGY